MFKKQYCSWNCFRQFSNSILEIWSGKVCNEVWYFFENIDKGGRKFLTLGAGLKYNNLGLDFSYLSTVENDHPLAETMRFSISFIFDKEETFDDLSNQ